MRSIARTCPYRPWLFVRVFVLRLLERDAEPRRVRRPRDGVDRDPKARRGGLLTDQHEPFALVVVEPRAEGERCALPCRGIGAWILEDGPEPLSRNRDRAVAVGIRRSEEVHLLHPCVELAITAREQRLVLSGLE